MPPKNSSKKKAAPQAGHDKAKPTALADGSQVPASAGTKRKANVPSPAEPAKAPRRSARGAAVPRADPVAIARLLTSPGVPDLARPKGEHEFLAANPGAKTYGDVLSLFPFEELVSAVVLSRPISHALGMRTLRTIFNGDYKFVTPGKLRDAGAEKRLQAVWDARTQHKDKTAQQLGELADVVCDKFAEGADDTSLEKLRKQAGHDLEKEREILQKSVKGLGKTGLNIFYRRVQATWTEAFPFADERTSKSLERLGLPESAEELDKFVNEKWNELRGAFKGEKDTHLARRKAFVLILERAVAIDLEGNIDELLIKAREVA